MKQLKKTVLILTAVLFIFGINNVVLASKGKVNINTAEKQELVTLKYVGDKVADKIIEFRKGQMFSHPEDIMQVKGIGQKIYNANKNLIIVKEE